MQKAMPDRPDPEVALQRQSSELPGGRAESWQQYLDHSCVYPGVILIFTVGVPSDIFRLARERTFPFRAWRSCGNPGGFSTVIMSVTPSAVSAAAWMNSSVCCFRWSESPLRTHSFSLPRRTRGTRDGNRCRAFRPLIWCYGLVNYFQPSRRVCECAA